MHIVRGNSLSAHDISEDRAFLVGGGFGLATALAPFSAQLEGQPVGKFAFHLGCKCHWLKNSMSPVEKHKTGKYPLENLPSSASKSSKKEDTILKIDLTLQPMRP